MSSERGEEESRLAESILREKSDEAAELEESIECVRGDVELLKLELRSAGIACESDLLVPALGQLRAGETPGKTIQELKVCLLELFTWVARRIDTSIATVFNAPGEIKVKSHRLRLGRMVGWPLTACGGQRLSVPDELREEVVQFLAEAKNRDSRSGTSEALAEKLVERFEMVHLSLQTGQTSQMSSVPAILLIDTSEERAIVVANWPGHQALHDHESESAEIGMGFDPNNHFNRKLQRFVLEPGNTMDADPEENVRLAVEKGNRVEAFYSGQWYAGKLKSVDDTTATVQCDVDDIGVLTVVPVYRVRLVQLKATPVANPYPGPIL